jgi:hypothetical protein
MTAGAPYAVTPGGWNGGPGFSPRRGRFLWPLADSKQATEQRNTNVACRTDGAGIGV